MRNYWRRRYYERKTKLKEKRLKMAPSPLRVCRVCELKALTEEDLVLFKKNTKSLHGRQRICKKCDRRQASMRVQINFKGKQITLAENPRTNKCQHCGKSYPEDLKRQTSMHHRFYDEENPLIGTIELCTSCHMTEHGKRMVWLAK